jgi:DNA-binding LacI/PurR family transcriptional regulator
MPAPTIYDIAARAGVGIATVSRVINGSRRVSEKTRTTVQAAMDELGFRPNHAARRLAAGAPHRPRVIALMPFFTTAFYFSVCKAISHVLSTANTDLVLLDVHDQEDADRHLDRLIAERSCEGVILCSMNVSEERHDQFATLKIPLVALDCHSEFIPHIRVDNVEGGRLLSRTLSEHGSKHQALVLGTRGALVFREREQGFLEVAPPSCKVFETEDVDVQSGARIAEEILASFPEVDGVACVGDTLAVGVMQTLRKHERRIPEDVQVMGFDDQPLMDALGLTTIRQPMEEFGRWAAAAVVELMTKPGASLPLSSVLPLHVIERKTTRRL